MKIVVAIDSFKGSASSGELNEAVKKGIISVLDDAEVKTFEIADGGEGTISAIKSAIGGELISLATHDLLNRPLLAKYLLLNQRAVIEGAEVIGIDKIHPSSKTFIEATSRGLAPLFLDAQKRGATEIVLGLGGSGTSDGGLGLINGLGGTFEDLPKLEGIKIIGLADVDNVYAGEFGYAKFFGPQKGGSPELIEEQDKKAKKVVQLIKEKRQLDLQKIKGSGAAGGLGGAVLMLGGSLTNGFSKIAELLQIEEAIKNADLVITGEGKMDNQTANGKVVYGMAKIAEKYQVPTLAFVGNLADDIGKMKELLLASYSIQSRPLSLEQAMEKSETLKNIKGLTENVVKTRYL